MPVKRSIWLLPACATLAVLSMSACVEREVVVRHDLVQVSRPPPPPPREEVPPPPGPSEVFVWQSGHWRWNGRDYYWQPGHWQRRPEHVSQWVPPHWDERGGYYFFVEGHWQ